MVPMTFWETAVLAENGIPTPELAGRALLEVEARLRRDIAHLRLSIAQLQQAVLELQQQVRELREASR